MKGLRIGTLFFALLIPLLVGGLSAALSAKGMMIYGTMEKPPLSPPAWVFPVAWTILYILMGIASYLVLESDFDSGRVIRALTPYFIQLVMNFAWSIVFFSLNWFLFAFIWLVVMCGIVITCFFEFYPISRAAAFLMLPYILWLFFAGYLNFGAYILNRR